jgi:hypothetical protein
LIFEDTLFVSPALKKIFLMTMKFRLSSSSASSLLLLAASYSRVVHSFAPRFSSSSRRSFSLKASSMPPFSVVVQAEIKSDRMDEFLKMIETNAMESRKEPGCMRFGEFF